MKIQDSKMKMVTNVLHSKAYAGETFRPNYIPYLCLKCKRVFKSRFIDGGVDEFCPLCSQKNGGTVRRGSLLYRLRSIFNAFEISSVSAWYRTVSFEESNVQCRGMCKLFQTMAFQPPFRMTKSSGSEPKSQLSFSPSF